MKQAIMSSKFLIATLGMTAVILLSCTEGFIAALRSEELLVHDAHLQLLLVALDTEGILLALPVLATLPFATAFIDDMKSGYIKQYLPRTGVDHYLTGKLAACILSGGLCILFGVLFSSVVLALMLLPKEAAAASVEDMTLRFLEKLMLLFASGALWSITGFLLASLSKSRYMAYAGPFVVCYVLVILHERYFENLYIFYPREWLNPSDKWVFGVWSVALLLFLLSSVAASTFALWARGRLVEV